VLVTRPQPGAAETVARLAALGWRPVLAPLLRVTTRALTLGTAPQAVLVTSGNAIPALPAALRAVPLLAVGDATAARARAAGFLDVASAGRDAEALAALAGQRCTQAGAPLLLASGAGQGAALAAALRAQGFRVLRRVAYAARPVGALPAAAARALRGGGLHAALFFSAETAAAFAVLVQRAGLVEAVAPVEALAISAATERALVPLPWRRIRVASHPTQDELLTLLP
jgi:uroporphyrinogen-III synthase